MRNAQRTTHHPAPSVVVEIRLWLALPAYRKLLGVGGRALPLEGKVAVNALSPAISAIADQPAVAVASRAVAASRPAKSTTAASAATKSSAATAPAPTAAAKSRTTSARSPLSAGSAWNAGCLALNARAQPTQSAWGALQTQRGSTQSKIILAILQACA